MIMKEVSMKEMMVMMIREDDGDDKGFFDKLSVHTRIISPRDNLFEASQN